MPMTVGFMVPFSDVISNLFPGIVDRVQKHKVYIVATNDRDLKRRIRKIPGVPIMSVARGKYVIERLPDAPEK